MEDIDYYLHYVHSTFSMIINMRHSKEAQMQYGKQAVMILFSIFLLRK